MFFSVHVVFLFSKWVCVLIWGKGNKQPQRKNCQERADVGEAGADGWYLQGHFQVLGAEVWQGRGRWVGAGEEVARAEVWGWWVKVPLSLLAQWVHCFYRGAQWRGRGEEQGKGSLPTHIIHGTLPSWDLTLSPACRSGVLSTGRTWNESRGGHGHAVRAKAPLLRISLEKTSRRL